MRECVNLAVNCIVASIRNGVLDFESKSFKVHQDGNKEGAVVVSCRSHDVG